MASEGFFAGAPEGEGEFLGVAGDGGDTVFGDDAGGVADGVVLGVAVGETAPLLGTGGGPAGRDFEAGGSVDGATLGVPVGETAPLVGAGGGPAGTDFEGEAEGAADGTAAGGATVPLPGAGAGA